MRVRRVSLSGPVAVLWADDRTYAGYLTSTFELSWVPVGQRIKELLEEKLARLADEQYCP